MGLGKTVQALALAALYRRDGPCLVLVPPTLAAAWADAIPRWLPCVPARAVHTPPSPARLAALLRAAARPPRDPWDAPPPLAFVVVSYDLLARAQPPLRDLVAQTFASVVADEAHSLRNIRTARAQAVLPVLLAARRRILISGTPALSRPSELYPLLYALLSTPDAPFMPCDHFVHRYCAGNPTAARAVAYEDELNLLLSSVMIRRSKAEVNHALPEKRRRHVVVDVAESLLQPLRKMRTDLDQIAERVSSLQADPSAVAELHERRKAITASMFHKTANVKIPGVVTRVRQLLRDDAGPAKFLVFAHHLHVLDAVEALAEREAVAYVRIDGGVAANRRQQLVTRFQELPEVKMAILSLAVAGTGLTLTAADVVLFAELSWVPSILAQAEDRAHRLGRERPVTMEYLFAPGTVDDMMWTTVKGKLDVLNKTVDGSELKRKAAFDLSNCSEKRIRISEVDVQALLTDTINEIERQSHGKERTQTESSPGEEGTSHDRLT